MTDSEIIEIPLLDAFKTLMELEFKMPNKGIDLSSYLLLIETLKNGYGLNSKDELIFLCKKLWLKPFHLNSNVLNEKVLEDVLKTHLEKYQERNLSSLVENVLLEKPSTPKDDSRNNNEEIERKNENVAKNAVNETPKKNVSKINEATAVADKYLSMTISDGEGETKDANEQEDISNQTLSRNYIFNKKYSLLSQRYIEQTIRSLRFKIAGEGRMVINIAATVNEVAQRGYVNDWILTEEDGFVTKWNLLIDCSDSMVAFQDLLEALKLSLQNPKPKNEGGIFYFQNYATKNLYLNREQTHSIPLRQFCNGTSKNILIVSDAGSARRNYNAQRIEETFNMLFRLRRHRVAWLNPMPMKRWGGTSTEEIRNFVDMFEVGDDMGDNLGNVLQVLKAKKIV